MAIYANIQTAPLLRQAFSPVYLRKPGIIGKIYYTGQKEWLKFLTLSGWWTFGGHFQHSFGIGLRQIRVSAESTGYLLRFYIVLSSSLVHELDTN